MARMAFGRIASPIHDEVGSLFHFAECTGNFTTQLGGDFGGTVSQRGMAVQQPSQLIGHRNAFFLSFTRGVAHPIHQRHVR